MVQDTQNYYQQNSDIQFSNGGNWICKSQEKTTGSVTKRSIESLLQNVISLTFKIPLEYKTAPILSNILGLGGCPGAVLTIQLFTLPGTGWDLCGVGTGEASLSAEVDPLTHLAM